MISGGGQVTPITNTDGLGHCGTGMDACSASSEASDSSGHLSRALQVCSNRQENRIDGVAVWGIFEAA